MDKTVKGVIAVVITIFILAVAVYGSYLPLRKAQAYIYALESFQSQPPSSLTDLETRISSPLDKPSPIGEEELVRNTANSVLSLIQHGVGATSTKAVVGYLDSYYNPIIAQGKGMSFGQDLYLEGAVHEVAFAMTGDGSFLDAARQNYLEGNQLGPNRPQSLYGLFDVYRAAGDTTDAIAIAQKILANWPSDASVQGALQQYLKASATSTHAK